MRLEKKMFVVLFFLSAAIGCKKNADQALSPANEKYKSIVDVKIDLMTTIMQLAKQNPVFKATVEGECLKQAHGDYEVRMERLLELDKEKPIMPAATREKFALLIDQMKRFHAGGIPVIFVPVMETRDPSVPTAEKRWINDKDAEKRTQYFRSLVTDGNIMMVDRENDVHPSSPDDPGGPGGFEEPNDNPYNPCSGPPISYPGYTINDAGVWTWSGCITEALAWTNDIWVSGFEEEVSYENTFNNSLDAGGNLRTARSNPGPDARTQGSIEKTGNISIDNVGAIESWVQGKLELKYFVYSSTATLLKERPLGKIKRSTFANSRWVLLADPIGYWNTSNWGNITYERWIEEDGGSSDAITSTVTYTNPSTGITNTYTISSPAHDLDENLGTVNVQFTDPTYVYPYVQSYWPSYTFFHMRLQRQDW